MKMFARAACLPALLVVATCLNLSACGQGGKGKKHTQPAQPSGPFAGKTMAMKQAAYTLNMNREDALYAFQFDSPPDYTLMSINAYDYDDQGRLTREIIVTLPQSPVSNIPDDGAIAYDAQFTYSRREPWKEEFVLQQTWDAWGDGGTGALQTRTTWSGNIEERTLYNTSNPGQILSTSTLEIRDQINAQGYVTSSAKYLLGSEPPMIQNEETFYRGADGIRLDGIESDWETTEYSYYPNGALESMETNNEESGYRTFTSYEYTADDGFYVIAAETRMYSGDGMEVGVHTALEVFESGFCHEAMRRRTTFEKPNWAVCRELSNWQ